MKAQSSNAGRIPTLDGLRAIAILIVVFSHAMHENERLAALGHMGVMIFFALSGYLITTRLLEEYRRNGLISLRDFYIRRAFRILPPALTYLGVVAILSAAGIVICNGSAIRSALFFYMNYVDEGELSWRVIHFWSLSVEEHFYLLWPVLLLAFGIRQGWKTAVGLATMIIVWRPTDHHFQILFQIFHDPHIKWNFSGTDVIADTLLWGCCVAFFRFKLTPFVSTMVAGLSSVLLAIYTMGIRLPFTPHHIEFILTVTHLLPALLLGAIIACPGAPIGRLLDLAPLRFIGVLSYSLYIWQQLFLGGHGLPLPVALAAVFICAYLSYRLIEKPCIAAGRRVIRRWDASKTAGLVPSPEIP